MKRHRRPSSSPPTVRYRNRERGTVLPLVLVLAVVVGGSVSTFLGRAVMEQSRVNSNVAREQAHWRANGQLELARQKIARALYVNNKNDVIEQALASNPPIIPGTDVVVEQVAGTKWHRLTAIAEYGRETGAVQAWVRDTTSYVAYNYYVEGDDLGVSGTPNGRIHANGLIQVFFGNGRFDNLVSSHNGFEYLNGATPENTNFAGGADGSAELKDLLSGISYPDLEAQATYVGLPGHAAEVYLQGKNIRVREIVPPYQVDVTETKYYWNYIGDALVDVTIDVYVGDIVESYQSPVYRTEYQDKNVLKSRQVWVEFADGGTGTDSAGGTTATGYWTTEYYYEMESVAVQVLDHYETLYRTVPDYEQQVVQQWEPQYEKVYYTQTKKSWVTNELAADQTFPAEGVFYFSGELDEIGGTVNGHVTLVTEAGAEVEGSVQYVDDAGNTAYLNGTDASQPYIPNPDFVRDHSFAIVAQDNITYDRDIPNMTEINGTLISTAGFVGYEGVGFDQNGKPKRISSAKTRTSLRRFGSIMSMRRPIATLLNLSGGVEHGFVTGTSIYDTGLINSPPPGAPDADAPMFQTTVRVEGAIEVGDGVSVQMPTGTTALAGLAGIPVLKNWVDAAPTPMDWGYTQ